MKLYPFLSCLPFFLLPTFSNPLPAIDNNAQLEFTEISSPSFAGQFDSQFLQDEGSSVQVDKSSNLNPLLFSVASENSGSQIESFSQISIAEGQNPGFSGSVCNDGIESNYGSENVNTYRIRRNEAMCAVKDEDRDWDTLWSTFSKTRALTNGEVLACTNPDHPVHVCCRGPPSKYVWNQDLMRVVKNCAPYLMLCARPYLNLCCKEFEPLSADSPGSDCIYADTF